MKAYIHKSYRIITDCHAIRQVKTSLGHTLFPPIIQNQYFKQDVILAQFFPNKYKILYLFWYKHDFNIKKHHSHSLRKLCSIVQQKSLKVAYGPKTFLSTLSSVNFAHKGMFNL